MPQRIFGLMVLIASVSCSSAYAQMESAADPNAACVVVAGAVRQPSRLELRTKPVRVLDAITFAGGPADFAAETIRLVRTGQVCYAEAWAHKTWPDRPLPVSELSLKDVLRGDASKNVLLNPGDVVVLDATGSIYVRGLVAKPLEIYFKEPLNLLKVVEASGPIDVTSETKIVIYRASADRHYKEFGRVTLDELKKHPEHSPLLKANDIIDVGPAGFLNPKRPVYDSPPFDLQPARPLQNRVISLIVTS